MKKRIEPKYKFLGIFLLFVIGIIAITAAPIGTKPIPGHNGSQIQPGTILGDRMADNLNLTGNVSINDVLFVKGSNVNITGNVSADSFIGSGSALTGVPPTGSIIMWGTTTAPTGWVLCDGSSLNRTGTYSDLFAVIGTTYGNVSATHFNVPNFKGKVPVGYNAAETEFDAMGETSGVKTVTLTTAQIPSHRHGYMIQSAGQSGATQWLRKIYDGSATPDTTSYTEYEGGGEAHDNLQPYITLNYIIKY